MLWIDIVILGIIAFSALVSLIRGFVKEALSLVIWFGAFFVSSQFYAQLSVYFTRIDDATIRNAAAAAALFVATLIVGAVVNYVIGQLVQKTGLSGTDRVLGIAFGALRGVLIMAAILFFADAFTGLNNSDWWQQSELIPHFQVIIKWFYSYLEESSSFLSGA
uniref:CvpA family protein n=1 Tax=Thaumasiovibrio occultus TaxID=1891184 RepID=UPI000B3622C2|nr:CvpA family protein [Thaumasiovibrio occultus]